MTTKNKSITKKAEEGAIIGNVVLKGDLSGLNPQQKVHYYNQFCQSLGLNPLTQPFQILRLNGKEVLYAKKDATEQLRKVHGVSITNLEMKTVEGVYIVFASAEDKSGKKDSATGAVSIKGLAGDTLANAMMKAETKAKRRVTLSICGLGMLDETETETIPNAESEPIPSLARKEDVEKIKKLLPKKGKKKDQVVKAYKIEKLEDMTEAQAKSVIKRLESLPDSPVEGGAINEL